jgi:hypothetical protein
MKKSDNFGIRKNQVKLPTGPIRANATNSNLAGRFFNRTTSLNRYKKIWQKPITMTTDFLPNWEGYDAERNPILKYYTSIPVNYVFRTSYLKSGMKLALCNENLEQEIILTADVNIADTTLSVESFNPIVSFPENSYIRINRQNLLEQYQKKTEGQVAGFDIDADGIAKGGVEITGWLDSDTMTGATANNVPTAESVKAYVDASGGVTTGLSLFSMITCSATTETSNLDGYAHAVVMKFDTETVSYGTAANIISYGVDGIEGISNSSFCIYIKYDDTNIRFFEMVWNVASNTEVTNNRLLSGINLQEGTLSASSITWVDLAPTNGYIYDRGAGNIRKGSTAGSIIVEIPTSASAKYYRMQFWKEKGSQSTTKSISILNGTQLTIKQIG